MVARLPVTARQLVDASPSMTRDGALVLGTRTSVVFALDAERGTLLRTFTAEGVVMHAAPGDADGEADFDVFALDAAAAEDASSPSSWVPSSWGARSIRCARWTRRRAPSGGT